MKIFKWRMIGSAEVYCVSYRYIYGYPLIVLLSQYSVKVKMQKNIQLFRRKLLILSCVSKILITLNRQHFNMCNDITTLEMLPIILFTTQDTAQGIQIFWLILKG